MKSSFAALDGTVPDDTQLVFDDAYEVEILKGEGVNNIKVGDKMPKSQVAIILKRIFQRAASNTDAAENAKKYLEKTRAERDKLPDW